VSSSLLTGSLRRHVPANTLLRAGTFQIQVDTNAAATVTVDSTNNTLSSSAEYQ
jgi:hypothetical protein